MGQAPISPYKTAAIVSGITRMGGGEAGTFLSSFQCTLEKDHERYCQKASKQKLKNLTLAVKMPSAMTVLEQNSHSPQSLALILQRVGTLASSSK